MACECIYTFAVLFLKILLLFTLVPRFASETWNLSTSDTSASLYNFFWKRKKKSFESALLNKKCTVLGKLSALAKD